MTDFWLKQAAYPFVFLKVLLVPGADTRKRPSPVLPETCLEEMFWEGCTTVTLLLLKVCRVHPRPPSFQWRGEKQISVWMFAAILHNKSVTSLHLYDLVKRENVIFTSKNDYKLKFKGVNQPKAFWVINDAGRQLESTIYRQCSIPPITLFY